MSANTQSIESFRVPKGFRGRSIISVQLWRIVQTTIFRFSPRICNGWRRLLLQLFRAKIGKKVIIRPSVKILYPWFLEVGNYSWIGDNVTLYDMAKITIGKNTVISQNSYLCAGSHDYKSESFDIIAKPINIGNKVWIAADVFIAPNVTIKDGAVVGSRSNVTKNLPSNMVCIGNPAKPIKPR